MIFRFPTLSDFETRFLFVIVDEWGRNGVWAGQRTERPKYEHTVPRRHNREIGSREKHETNERTALIVYKDLLRIVSTHKKT